MSLKSEKYSLLAITLVLIFLSGCSHTLRVQKSSVANLKNQQQRELPNYQSWQNVLGANVNNEGQIDFEHIKENPEQLEKFVSWIANHSPKSTPELFPQREDQLSFYINSYNALAVYGIIRKDIPTDFDSFSKQASFFYLTNFVVGGEEISLYDYENKVIRPLGEEKIHFALNCMVKSCPRLPKTAFVSSKLQSQLIDVTKEFFASEKHLQVDLEKKIVNLSTIIKFYTEDFITEKTPSLIDYINLWVTEPIPSDYKVKFIPYNWKVNIIDE